MNVYTNKEFAEKLAKDCENAPINTINLIIESNNMIIAKEKDTINHSNQIIAIAKVVRERLLLLVNKKFKKILNEKEDK